MLIKIWRTPCFCSATYITLVGAKIGITLVKGTPHLSACLGFWATQKQLPLVIVKKICLLDLGGASAAMGRQFHFRAHTRTYGAVSGLCSTSRVTQLWPCCSACAFVAFLHSTRWLRSQLHASVPAKRNVTAAAMQCSSTPTMHFHPEETKFTRVLQLFRLVESHFTLGGAWNATNFPVSSSSASTESDKNERYAITFVALALTHTHTLPPPKKLRVAILCWEFDTLRNDSRNICEKNRLKGAFNAANSFSQIEERKIPEHTPQRLCINWRSDLRSRRRYTGII